MLLGGADKLFEASEDAPDDKFPAFWKRPNPKRAELANELGGGTAFMEYPFEFEFFGGIPPYPLREFIFDYISHQLNIRRINENENQKKKTK